MSDKYHPKSLKEDAIQKKLMLDTAVDVQTIMQILVKNNIATKEEIDEIRIKVKSLPKYKAAYEMVENINMASELYKNDPQAYLKALFNDKLHGRD